MKTIKKAMPGLWQFSCNPMGIQSGKQRFKCKNCGIFFTRNDPDQRLANRFIWFRKWILERQTFKTLSRDSNLSIDTLQRIFYTYLRKSPVVKIIKRDHVHLRMDATYFKHFCLLCYQDHEDGYTQLIRFSDGEHFAFIADVKLVANMWLRSGDTSKMEKLRLS